MTDAELIGAWLDGNLRLDNLRERMGLTRVQLRRMRLAVAEAAVAELGRLGVSSKAIYEAFGHE